MHFNLTRRYLILVALSIGLAAPGSSQTSSVSAHVQIAHLHHAGSSPASSAGAVVWLAATGQKYPSAVDRGSTKVYTLVQKNKKFTPHLLVIPTGSTVDFPNLDPFFHNVFSLFNGTRFDLGLYEAHTHRAVHFDREGVSYIFCNIHPDMAAVIVTVSTPYYGVSDPDGAVVIHNVPPGSYRLHIWAEDVDKKDLEGISRLVQITQRNTQLGAFHLITRGDVMRHHKNKFGDDYPPALADHY